MQHRDQLTSKQRCYGRRWTSQNSRAGTTSVPTFPGHRADASTSAIVFSAIRFLLFASVENGRAVACAHVVPLTIQSGRMMNLEEEIQQIAVCDFRGVEDNLNRLGVTPVIPIGRVRHVSTRVSYPRRRDETSSAVESRHPRASRAERQNPLRPSAVPVLMGCSGCAAADSNDTSSRLGVPGLQSQYAVRSVPSALRRIRDESFHD